MKEKKKRDRGKLISRIIGVPLGGLVGYWLAVLALNLFKGISESLSPLSRSMVLLVSAVLFAVIFCISAPAFLGWILNIGYAFERTLNKYNPKDIAGGGIGLVAGLFVAFLISNLLELIPIEPLMNTLIILAYLLFGIVGMVLGTRKLGGIIVVKDKSDLEPTTPMKVLDSSAIIDGRIFDLARTGFIEGTFVVPNFILDELRTISDSADDIKRSRGRRGLDLVARMQQTDGIKVIVSDDNFPAAQDTDAKLLMLCEKLNARVVTTDFNLNKVAGVMHIPVLNVNELANALKPPAIPGETMKIDVVKPGKDPSQGVGYLSDGTMVVVENGGGHIGESLVVTVTTSLQTNAGRMIFTKI